MAMNILEKYNVKMQISQGDLRAATDDELLGLKVIVDTEIAKIGSQLSLAKSKARKGEYSDSAWFNRAKMAKKLLGQLSQRIQNELARRRAERRKNHEYRRKYETLLRAINETIAVDQREKLFEEWRRLME